MSKETLCVLHQKEGKGGEEDSGGGGGGKRRYEKMEFKEEISG